MKLRQFLLFESISLVLLLTSLWLARATHLGTGGFADVFRLLPLAFAAAVTLLPILYFALPPRFPRAHRSDTP